MKKPDTTQRLEEALSDVHPDEKDALRTMWHLSEHADEVPNIGNDQVDALWKNLATMAGDQATPSITKPLRQDRQPIKRSNPKWVSQLRTWGSVAVLLLTLGLVFLFRPIVKTAPFGEHITANLPDGSVVELNSGSSITYPRFFTGNRSVSLAGEAYFDVTESDVPFIVHTFNAEVHVLGTTFNVKAWEDGWQPESKVTLASGSVRLIAKQAPEDSIILVPGQTVAVQQGEQRFVESESEQMDHLLAWRKGELVFKNQKLILVLEEIERRFGLDVELRMDHLAEKEVTFAYRQATSAELILENLCHALDLQYRPISNGYELFKE